MKIDKLILKDFRGVRELVLDLNGRSSIFLELMAWANQRFCLP